MREGDRTIGVCLEGLHILCTGGVGTLASTFAVAAARAGARITLVDLPPVIEAGEAKEAVLSRFAEASVPTPALLSADITRPEEFTSALHAESVPDVAINFAGVHHAQMHLALDDPAEALEAFRRVTEINLNGAFAFTAACAKAMVANGNGHIIHLCSNGSRVSLYGSYGYVASKHGVEGLVRTAAAQLAPFGVRVNGVAPGTVVTDLNRALIENADGSLKARARSILAHTPTKRFATAEGVAESILAMCVPQRHFTGNVIFPDDGYNVEGHSWPEGNQALYSTPGIEGIDALYRSLEAGPGGPRQSNDL